MRRLAALVLAFAAACGAPRDGGVVPLSELPPEYRALLVAYGRGGEEWAAAREEALADPKQTRFLVDNLAREMVRAFDRSAIGTAREPAAPFERAQRELAGLGDPAAELLVGMVGAEDDVLGFLGGQTLARMGPDRADDLLPLLDHARPQVRRRAAEWLGAPELAPGVGEAGRARLVATMRTDEAWIVRAQAARSLRPQLPLAADPDPLRRELEASVRDPDLAVAFEAGRSLASRGDPRSIPSLVHLAHRARREGDPTRDGRAQGWLATLTGVPGRRDAQGWWAVWAERRDLLVDPRTGAPRRLRPAAVEAEERAGELPGR